MKCISTMGDNSSEDLAGKGLLKEFNSAFLDDIEIIGWVTFEENELALSKVPGFCKGRYFLELIVTKVGKAGRLLEDCNFAI